MERRASERYRIWFPMTVVTDGGEEGTAITYDASASGVSMACPGRLEVGQHVELRFRVEHDEPERAIGARVLRVDENPEEHGLWRYRMAVQFDEAQPELEGVLESASAENA